MNSLPNPDTHETIIFSLYREIELLFQQAGAYPPDLIDLYHSEHWRYCRPLQPKNKSKIGYICSFDTQQGKPVVRIIVHSFIGGGASFTFNSLHYTSKDSYLGNKVAIKRPSLSLIQQRKQKEQQEIDRKNQLFLTHKALWEQGSSAVQSHAYVQNKKMVHCADLRVTGEKLLLPIRNFDGIVIGIQCIFPSGKKLIFGKKKGGFLAIGDLESARQLFFCEGFATGNAVAELVKKTQYRKQPFAVIVAWDNHNLETVAGLFKTRFSRKKLWVCPDNDVHKVSSKNGNAGMLSGLRCVLDYRYQCRFIPDELLAQGQSDWCDLWLADPEQAIQAFHEKNTMTRWEAALARCRYFALGDTSIGLKKACVRALNIGSAAYPVAEDEPKLLARVREAIHYSGIHPQQIKAWWQKIKRRTFAKSLRSRSVHKIQSTGIQHQHCSSMEALHQKMQQLKTRHPKAVFITNAPMGEGKTKHFIQPEFMRADIQGEMPVIITPNRSLTRGVSQRLQCAHYIEDDFSTQTQGCSLVPGSLAITINSIISPKFQDLFTFSRSVFIEEYTQVLRAITSGTVEEHQRSTTEKRLATLIKNSDYTYIADADFNQVALDHLQDIVGQEKEIILFSIEKEQTRKKQKGIEYRFIRDRDARMGHYSLGEQIVSAAKKGEPLYVVSDSRKQLAILESQLAREGIDSLFIHSDNVNFAQQKEFLQAPDAYLASHQPQVVLASPAIQSGISIEADYFKRCFGLYKGIVEPLVFQQMLHRVRTQKCFELSLPRYTDLPAHVTQNATAILTAAYQQHFEQAGGAGEVRYDAQQKTHHIGAITLRQEGHRILIEGDADYGRFEELSAQIQALDNEQRHHGASFLLLQAMDRGITITPTTLSHSEEERGLLKQQYRTQKEQVDAREVKCIVEAELQENNTAYDPNTAQDYYAAKRVEITDALQQEPEKLSGEDVRFYQEQGHRKVANYQALLQGPDQAKALDLHDKTKGVAKTHAHWRESKVQLLECLFDILAIDKQSGEGQYRAEQSQQLRQCIRESEPLARYVTFRLGLMIDSQLSDTAFTNKILKKVLGLTTCRKMVRDQHQRVWQYTVDPCSMQRLKHYHRLKFGK